MRRAEPLEPDAAAALATIEATLAGDAVDPAQAELAELTLLLRDARPSPDAATARRLDERAAELSRERAPRSRASRRTRPGWVAAPVAALAAVVLVAVALSAGGGGGRVVAGSGESSSAGSSHATATSASASAAGSAARSPSAPATTAAPPAHAAAPTDSSASGAASSSAPAPPASGPGKRQVVQSGQLSLSAPARRIDDVAQQVFDVVDSENGIVQSSHITSTGGPDASARFSLSLPVTHLQRAVSELSQLHGARVLSRTDDSNDITGEVGAAGRRLAEARALRRALLRRLAAAPSSEAIASLRAQLRDADAAIARAAAGLGALHRQVDYSSLTVSIQAAAVAPTPAGRGGGFTIARALHDAGRVLVVAAGVALIALAVLVPLGLLVALALWAAATVRRRRREAMLDLM